jgi:F0F1-type ATP synthase epsilon subunit
VAEPFRLVVLTPVKTLIEAAGVAWVQIQLADGAPIGIYPGHAPLLAETVDGPLRYADEAGEYSLDLLAGILSTSHDGVTVLTAGLAHDGRAVGWRTEESSEYVGAGEEAEEPRFERLAQALLGYEGGFVKRAMSWLIRYLPPRLQ